MTVVEDRGACSGWRPMSRQPFRGKLDSCPGTCSSTATSRASAEPFASFKGHESPLRHRPTLCRSGGHAIWWTVEAETEAEPGCSPTTWPSARQQAASARSRFRDRRDPRSGTWRPAETAPRRVPRPLRWDGEKRVVGLKTPLTPTGSAVTRRGNRPRLRRADPDARRPGATSSYTLGAIGARSARSRLAKRPTYGSRTR